MNYRIHILVLTLVFGVWSQENIKVTTKVFSKSNEQIMDVSYPVEYGTLLKSTPQLDSKQASYIRILSTYTDSTSLSSVSDHREVMNNDKVKLVLWTRWKMASASTEIMVKSLQQFAYGVMFYRSSEDDPLGQMFSLSGMGASRSLKEFEVEIMEVSDEMMRKKEICSNNGTKDVLSCPSMVLLDDLGVSVLVGQNLVMNLDNSTLGTSSMGQAVYLADKSPFNVNNRWYGVPLTVDTRVLAVNKTVFSKLNLKLPPPHADWGRDNNEWNWETLIKYASDIKKNMNTDGFYFYGSENDEDKLIHSMALASGNKILEGNSFSSRLSKTMEETIGKLYDTSNRIGNTDYLPENDVFKSWAQKPLRNPLRPPYVFCCKEFSKFNPGIGFVGAAQIRNGVDSKGGFVNEMSTAEVLPAFLPGKAYLGGLGLSLISKSSLRSVSWYFVNYLVSPSQSFINDFSLVSKLPVPLTALRSQNSTNNNGFYDQQLQLTEPLRKSFDDNVAVLSGVEKLNPLRSMLMEYAYGRSSLQDAVKRSSIILKSLSLPRCNDTEVKAVVSKCDSASDYRFVDFTGEEFIKDDKCVIRFDEISDTLSGIKCSFIEPSSVTGLTIYVVAAILIVFCLILFALTLFWKGSWWIWKTTITFLGIILFGGIFISAGVVLFVGYPTVSLCSSRMWIVSIGYFLIAGSFFVASVLIKISYNSNDPYFYPTGQYTKRVLLIFVVVLVLLIMLTVYDQNISVVYKSFRIENVSGGSTLTVDTPVCSSGHPIIFYLFVGFCGAISLLTSIFSYRNRKCTRSFSEPTLIFVISLCINLSMVVLITLSMFLDGGEEYSRLIALSFGLIFVTFTVIGTYFTPKLHQARTGSEPDELPSPSDLLAAKTPAFQKDPFNPDRKLKGKSVHFSSDMDTEENIPSNQKLPRLDSTKFGKIHGLLQSHINSSENLKEKKVMSKLVLPSTESPSVMPRVVE
ncbi:hypothetical protein MP638_005276 [Amoeboaphelidium occidentale]|nr:hypothetical protein MP638_005276 [Amoeboaphelidium occidentale]